MIKKKVPGGGGGRLLIEWPPNVQAYAKDVNESGEWDRYGFDEQPDIEDLESKIYADSFFFEGEWDYITEDLSMLMRDKPKYTSYWKADVTSFGWRGLSGQSYFRADNGQELLSAVLPNTQNHFMIYNYRTGFAINNSHHDSPMGTEWYKIVPIAESTYYANT